MKLLKFLTIVFFGGLFLVSCDADLLNFDWSNQGGNKERKLSIRLTDGPIDAEEVNVDIQGVVIITDDGLNTVDLETEAGVYNLLDYQNGASTVIANAIIDFDNIKEIRLILGEENSIKIDGTVYPLQIPSGQQTGLKIKVNIDVSNEELVEILIDFDALKSIVEKGNGEYLLKPVIKVKDIVLNGEEDLDEEAGEEGESEVSECVRGKGYWKTHSEMGPAPYDEAWGLTELGAATAFIEEGTTYIEFLEMPSGNNPYVALAQQYIIAELNSLSGAPVPGDVLAAWEEARTLLDTYAEDMVIGAADEEKAEELTELLREYNDGELDVPECDDLEDEEGEDEEEGDGESENEEGEGEEGEDEVACVRGKGYWKTHSEAGPAPFDEAWTALAEAEGFEGDGAEVPFFETGKTYLYMLDIPGGNNAYVKLSHEYIIAYLNVLSGADLPESVATAWDEAAVILETYAVGLSITDAADETRSKELRQILSMYNEGEMGVPDCDSLEDEEEDGDDEDDSEEGENEEEDGEEEDDEDDEEEGPCNRGKGYWKTHSEKGPAPFDEAWAALAEESGFDGDGADVELFETGITYLEFLDMTPGNNQYTRLAQQYIIAHLNVLSGVEIPAEAADAWTQAGELLEANAENRIFEGEDKDLAKELEKTLVEFNEGEMGVPSCD